MRCAARFFLNFFLHNSPEKSDIRCNSNRKKFSVTNEYKSIISDFFIWKYRLYKIVSQNRPRFFRFDSFGFSRQMSSSFVITQTIYFGVTFALNHHVLDFHIGFLTVWAWPIWSCLPCLIFLIIIFHL